MRNGKALFHIDYLQKFVPTVHLLGFLFTIFCCAIKQILLDFIHQRNDARLEIIHGDNKLLLGITTSDFNRARLQITHTHRQANRHTLQFPLGKLIARLVRIAIVKFNGQSQRF